MEGKKEFNVYAIALQLLEYFKGKYYYRVQESTK